MGAELWVVETRQLAPALLTYSPPSHYSTGIHPHITDPFEDNTVGWMILSFPSSYMTSSSDCKVRVARSLIPGAGEGLFVTREVTRGELVAFYSGFVNTCAASYTHLQLDRRVDTRDKEVYNNRNLLK